MLKNPSKKAAVSIKKFYGMVVLISLFVGILITTIAVQTRTSFSSGATNKSSSIMEDSLVFLATDRGFEIENTKLIMLNEAGCCKVLEDQYSEYGVRFINDLDNGYATYQRNGFVVSGDAKINTNSPNGVSATRVVFDKSVSKVGLVLSSGSIYDENRYNLAEPILLRSYDQNGMLIIQQEIDTCLGKEPSCTPVLLGFGSKLGRISAIEVVMTGDAPYSIGEIYIEEL